MQYPSHQGTFNTSTIPSSRAHPLNQGQSDTCTCYAIANAVGDQLADEDIDIDLNAFATVLINTKGSIGAVWPDFYDNYHIPIIIKNEDGGIHYSITITTVREVARFSNTDKHVLAYYTDTNDYHCVFVKEQLGNQYSCVNSWGDHDQYPQIELHKPHNRLWRVKVDFEHAQLGLSFVICYT